MGEREGLWNKMGEKVGVEVLILPAPSWELTLG
jgi:hypothetical protein